MSAADSVSVMLKRMTLIAIGGLVIGAAALFGVGSLLIAPVRRDISRPPAELAASDVFFESKSGARLATWYGPPESGRPVVVLSHGVRGARDQLSDRALFVRGLG